MAQTIKLKRSSTEGKIPTTSQLALGEIAINTFDGRIFFEKNDGSATIEQILTTDSITTGSITITGSLQTDNITIDNATISSDLDITLDSAGDIILDADATDIILKDGGTEFGRFKRDSSNFVIKSATSDKDIIFKGVDNSSTITALTLDMSDAGSATFNNHVTVGDDCTVTGNLGVGALNASYGFYNNTTSYLNGNTTVNANLTVDAGAISISGDGANAATLTETGAGLLTIATVDDLVLDSGADITIDAGGNDIRLFSSGTEFGKFKSDSSHLSLYSSIQDKDILFKGDDGGGAITALQLDMSDAGKAVFNGVGNADAGVTIDNITIDGTEIDSRGLKYKIYKTNDQYWAKVPDPEIIMKTVETGRRINDYTYQIRTNGVLSMLDLRSIPRVNKRVVMTTGSHHYQTYWIDGSVSNQMEQINESKYGNLFQMYEKIVDENPYETPMMIYPAVHYTMGGIWVDYNLMTTIDGLFACGEANFSDHGANRLGASALMQGLADGYFVAPQTVANYLAKGTFEEITHDHPEVISSVESVKNRIERLMNAPDPKHSPDYFHRKIGSILWTSCGMARDKDSLKKAIKSIEQIKIDFWNNIKVTGNDKDFNQTLEKAGRVADFIELGHLMCVDALDREESCGAHARLEYLAESGDAMRDDENFGYVAAWEFNDNKPTLHKENLDFEFIKPTYRDYK